MFNTLKGLARIKANDWKQTKYEPSWEGRPAVLCQRQTMARETYGYEAIESSRSAFNIGPYIGVQPELQINTDIFIIL